jgi:hypothetical protein
VIVLRPEKYLHSHNKYEKFALNQILSLLDQIYPPGKEQLCKTNHGIDGRTQILTISDGLVDLTKKDKLQQVYSNFY